jgi:glutaconyl-CoA/methylmalonyl-CoA decarboxylase subunit gamma
MELVVREGEREERVTVARDEDGLYRVTVGARAYRVDLARAAGALSLRLAEDAGGGEGRFGEQHEVSVRPAPHAPGTYQVTTSAGTAAVEVLDPLAALARGEGGGKGGKRRARVAAYMPGRVVAVLAPEGAEVKAGDGVIVLEAMKMQNEIQAEHDGRIAKVFVEAGQAVEGGDPLFELE